MVGAVEVADGDVFVLDVDAGEGTVVEQEPASQSVRGVLPGQVEDGAHQVHEESAVANEEDALFGLTLPVAVTSQQVPPDARGAQLTFVLGLMRTFHPPAVFIQRFGEFEAGETGLEEGPRFAGQSLEFFTAVAPVDAAALVDVPRFKRDLEPVRRKRGGVHSPFHERGVDAGDAEAVTVVYVPVVRFGEGLVALEKICHDLRLFDASLCERGVGAFRVVWVAPARVVDGLSVTDEVELHVCLSLCGVLWWEDYSRGMFIILHVGEFGCIL